MNKGWIFLVLFLGLGEFTSAHNPCDSYYYYNYDDECDPCLEENHRILDDPSRSVYYYDPDLPLLNDYYGINDVNFNYESRSYYWWYRSVIPGAEDMAFAQPEQFHCQTEWPIWLNVTNYSLETWPENDTYVAYTYWSYYEYIYGYEYGWWLSTIYIKHCGSFNVYNLPPLYADSRYCFGGDPNCRDDDHACKAIFESKGKPKIAYDLQETEVSSNLCHEDINYECTSKLNDNSTALQVTWLINDHTIKQDVINYVNLPSVLTAAELRNQHLDYYGITLKCQIRVQNTTSGDFGEASTTEFSIGFKSSTAVIELTEGYMPENYVTTSTVPITCDYPCQDRDTYTCDVKIVVTIPPEFTSEVALQNDDDNDDSCITSVTLSSPGSKVAQLRIPLYPKLDGRYDGSKKFEIQFTLQQTGQSLSLPSAQVTVHDKDHTIARISCGFVNDPHAHTYDGLYYEMQLAGVFVLYKHTSSPIEVQGYFKDYGSYTGVCGVAVRSGGDLYIVNYCTDKGLVARFYECDPVFISNINVLRKGTSYTIYLPLGSKVEITQYSLYIYPSASDYNQTEGLCGTFNNNRNDDFKHRYTYEYEHHNERYPNAFSRSWRLDDKDSLFKGKIIDTDGYTFGDKTFCECDTEGKKKCTTIPIQTIVPIQGIDATLYNKIKCGIQKREISVTDDVDDDSELVLDYNPNFEAPIPTWDNGWTEASARNYCESFLLTRQSVQLCQDLDVVELDNNIASCMEDIYITGSTNFTRVQLSVVISQCREEILRNDTLVQSNGTNSTSDGHSPLDELLSSICASDCNDRGTCLAGVCICDTDYAGYDCSQDQNHVPALYSLPQGGSCDVSNRPCEATAIYGDLFVESDNITCEVQLLEFHTTQASGKSYHSAEFEHFQKIFCPIPKAIPPYAVGIAVSNNNITFSRPRQLVIYHITCWEECSYDDGGCKKKPASCLINGECYANGETNPADADEYCNPESDEYGWTLDEDTSLNIGFIIGMAMLCLALMIGIIAVIVIVRMAYVKRAKRRELM